MRAIHDYARVAWAFQALFVQSEGGLVKILVAVNLDLEAVV